MSRLTEKPLWIRVVVGWAFIGGMFVIFLVSWELAHWIWPPPVVTYEWDGNELRRVAP